MTLVWRWLGTSVYVSKLALALNVDYAEIYTFLLVSYLFWRLYFYMVFF